MLIKSRRTRLVEYVGHTEIHTKFLSGNLMGRDHLGDLSIVGRIILKWILGKQYDDLDGFIWLRIGTSRWLLRTW
jgi:hypothetical protein